MFRNLKEIIITEKISSLNNKNLQLIYSITIITL